MPEDSPLITCIMPTYGRPQYVCESVGMFLDQDFPSKELLIYNDCVGQTFESCDPEVRIVNTDRRFATLGEKRNACIQAACGEFIAIWDDDDVYLPWRLSLSLSEAERWNTPFYRPEAFLAFWDEDRLHDNHSVPGWLSHSTVMFRKALWLEVGGYPSCNVGEDAEFFGRIHAHLGQDFITYPIHPDDRFMILRGSSMYEHMSISGGLQALDTTPGVYPAHRRPISNPRLSTEVRRIKEACISQPR